MVSSMTSNHGKMGHRMSFNRLQKCLSTSYWWCNTDRCTLLKNFLDWKRLKIESSFQLTGGFGTIDNRLHKCVSPRVSKRTIFLRPVCCFGCDDEWSIGLTQPLFPRDMWQCAFLFSRPHSPWDWLSTSLPSCPSIINRTSTQLNARKVVMSDHSESTIFGLLNEENPYV